MRISDWSSDVCSSDLVPLPVPGRIFDGFFALRRWQAGRARDRRSPDRKNVVKGKSVSVCVDLGGRRFTKKKNIILNISQCTIRITNTIIPPMFHSTLTYFHIHTIHYDNLYILN